MPWFNGAAGRVYHRHWEAEDPRAQVVFVHGFGEHTGHYHRFAAALDQRRISVWGMDLIGHGLSEGERGVVTSVDDLAADAAALTRLAADEAPTLPLVLAGHSLGGVACAVLATADASPYAGLVLTGTPLDPLPDLDPEPEMSRDALYLDALDNDPLGFDEPGPVVALRDVLPPAQRLIEERLPALAVPVLFVNGSEDAFAPPARAARLASSLPRARLVVHDGGFHDILNDTMHRAVARDIADFVLEAT